MVLHYLGQHRAHGPAHFIVDRRAAALVVRLNRDANLLHGSVLATAVQPEIKRHKIEKRATLQCVHTGGRNVQDEESCGDGRRARN